VPFADDEAGVQGDSLEAARSGLGSAVGCAKCEAGKLQEVRGTVGALQGFSVWVPVAPLN